MLGQVIVWTQLGLNIFAGLFVVRNSVSRAVIVEANEKKPSVESSSCFVNAWMILTLTIHQVCNYEVSVGFNASAMLLTHSCVDQLSIAESWAHVSVVVQLNMCIKEILETLVIVVLQQH